MKEREGMQWVMRKDVWSNKGWYQYSEFKGQQGFGYESHPSTATSDLLPEGPGGCSQVIVFIFFPNSPWPPLSSICTSPLRPFISSPQLSTHKLLFSPLCSIHFRSFPSIHCPNRAIDSSAGHDRIVLECEDEKGTKKGRVHLAIRATLKSGEWSWGQHGGERPGWSGDQHWTNLRLFCVLWNIQTFQAIHAMA